MEFRPTLITSLNLYYFLVGCNSKYSGGRASIYELRGGGGNTIQSITIIFVFCFSFKKDKMKVFFVFLIHMVFLSTTISARRTQQACCGWKKDTVNYFSW